MWVCWPGTAQDHLRHGFSVRPVALVRELQEFKLPPLRSADLALAVAHGGRFVSFPSASKASTPFDFQDWTLEIRPDGVTFASFGLSQVTTKKGS